MGGSSQAMSVRAQDKDHDGIQFYFFSISPFPNGVVMLLFAAAHQASALTPAALVGQQWGWSGS